MDNINLEIPDLLRRHFPFLRESSLQKEIALVGAIHHFKEGEILMNFGSYIKSVPLLVKGAIKVVREDDVDGKELLLYFLHAGQTCSMSFSCCMMNKKSDIRTTVEDDATLIAIPIKYVDEWMGKYSSWKNFVMQSYDSRMREMVRTIDSIAFRKMDERLLEYLYQKSKVHQSKILFATHQEIADDLNASREAISRLLKKLENSNRVRLERNKIHIL